MIGAQQIEIGQADWIKGMSSSADITDGGFSNETDGVNLTKIPGGVYPSAQQIDTSTNLTGNLIASAGTNNQIAGSADRYFISRSGSTGATFYRWNGTALALAQTDSGSNVYNDGVIDSVEFASYIWTTTTSDLVRWDGTSTAGTSHFFTDYWTNAGGLNKTALLSGFGQPHPMLVYEKQLWIGDGRYLHALAEDGTTLSYQALDLGTSAVVVALSIDPASGKMLISTTEGPNLSDTLNLRNKIYLWDAFSIKPNKAIIVEDMVTAFLVESGVVYVTYGQSFGVFNGSGIDFLRKLKNVGFDNTQLVYKHRITSINRNIYIVDGTQILCYGEVIGQQKKVFYYSMKNSAGNQINVLVHVGSGKLGIGCATSKFYIVDTNSIATTNSMTLLTNKILFPRPVFLRGAYIEYLDAVVNNDGNRVLSYKTESMIGTGFVQLNQQNGTGLNNISGADVYSTNNITGFKNERCHQVQLRYVSSSVVSGLKRIILFYDIAE